MTRRDRGALDTAQFFQRACERVIKRGGVEAVKDFDLAYIEDDNTFRVRDSRFGVKKAPTS